MFAIMLAVSNFKKKLSVQLSFVALIAISTMLLISGRVLLFYVPSYYDASNERLKEPHYIIRMSDNSYSSEYLTAMREDERVAQAETVECILMDNAELNKGDNKMLVFATFFNADRQQPFFQFHPLISDESISREKAIFMPLSFKQQGYKIGDTVQFEVKKRTFEFTIAGFFETTWFGSSSTSVYNFYIYDEAYLALEGKSGMGTYLAARLHNKEETDAFAADYKESQELEFSAPDRAMTVLESTTGSMKAITTTLISIFSVLSVLISAIILGISFLVIWFSIANYIEDQLRQMGVLQAIGCTVGQIRFSIVMEYLLAGALGGIFGIAMSYGFLALMGTVISGTLGVLWKNQIHIGFDLSGFIMTVAVVLLISYLASGKIKHITPVVALRRGNASHHFKKNYFPLEEGGGGEVRLSLRLAFKTILHAPLQYITFGGIILCVTFVLSFSLILYQGLAADHSGFIRLAGMEISDATAYLAPHKDPDVIREKLEQMDEVDGTSIFQNANFRVDGIEMGGFISDDFGKLRTLVVYEGSLPIYDNEITVTGIVAERLGKKIGDTVTMEMDGAKGTYIICGLNQTLNNMGLQSMMTLDGARRLNPSVQAESFCIYLKDGVSYETFSDTLERQFKFMNGKTTEEGLSPEEELRVETEEKIADLLTMYGVDSAQYALMENGKLVLSGDSTMFELERIENTRVLVYTNMQLYVIMIRVLTIFLTMLTVGIIILILHFMVKSSIIRRKQELGIYKAMGYTSGQLMLQIAFCYLPLSVPGVVLGAIAAGSTVNSVMSWMMKMVGVSRMGFTVSPVLLSMGAVSVLAVIFLVAFVMAKRVKKVSVYELFTE